METTGINKTVYRSNVISALDSFTSVRNVLAWEMFQDGQVRNYDGVIGDLKRLYPNIDFDSVTENVDPESIAADENAIYALVDNIINKLIESGISKDNFNYAIWACDDPENVADTYGVDIDDVSAYKITDGILLQDLGYEGQLYGVAEYPEEEWDVIESALIKSDLDDSYVYFCDFAGNEYCLLRFRKNNYALKALIGDYWEKVVGDIKNPKKCLSWDMMKVYLKDELNFKDWEIDSIYARLEMNSLRNGRKDDELRRSLTNSFQGGDMKTREEYKDYYLEQLTEQFGDMTEADYNSAKKFCYDEEWNLGEVGNMAEAIDGLGDAWTEYQKQYKEGFEIMNNRQIKSGYERNADSIRKIFSSVTEADVEKYTLDDFSFGFWGAPDIKSDEELSRKFDVELDIGDYIAAYLSAKENGVDISSKNEKFFQECLEYAKPENNWYLKIHDEYIKHYYEKATHGDIDGESSFDLKEKLNKLKQELDSTEPWKENKIIRLQYNIDEKEAEIKGYQEYLGNKQDTSHNRYHDDYADLYWQGKAPEHYNRYMAKLKAEHPGSF